MALEAKGRGQSGDCQSFPSHDKVFELPRHDVPSPDSKARRTARTRPSPNARGPPADHSHHTEAPRAAPGLEAAGSGNGSPGRQLIDPHRPRGERSGSDAQKVPAPSTRPTCRRCLVHGRAVVPSEGDRLSIFAARGKGAAGEPPDLPEQLQTTSMWAKLGEVPLPRCPQRPPGDPETPPPRQRGSVGRGRRRAYLEGARAACKRGWSPGRTCGEAGGARKGERGRAGSGRGRSCAGWHGRRRSEQAGGRARIPGLLASPGALSNDGLGGSARCHSALGEPPRLPAGKCSPAANQVEGGEIPGGHDRANRTAENTSMAERSVGASIAACAGGRSHD